MYINSTGDIGIGTNFRRSFQVESGSFSITPSTDADEVVIKVLQI